MSSLSILIVLLSTFFSNIGYAGWPIFPVPTPQEIMNNLISTNGCANGEGYIPSGKEIKIKNYYIPRDETWFWQYTGNNKCQPLPKDLQYIAFHQTGHYSGDLINTVYATASNSLFQFTFTIPESDWYCGYLAGPNPPETIACARDQ